MPHFRCGKKMEVGDFWVVDPSDPEASDEVRYIYKIVELLEQPSHIGATHSLKYTYTIQNGSDPSYRGSGSVGVNSEPMFWYYGKSDQKVKKKRTSGLVDFLNRTKV